MYHIFCIVWIWQSSFLSKSSHPTSRCVLYYSPHSPNPFHSIFINSLKIWYKTFLTYSFHFLQLLPYLLLLSSSPYTPDIEFLGFCSFVLPNHQVQFMLPNYSDVWSTYKGSSRKHSFSRHNWEVAHMNSQWLWQHKAWKVSSHP